MRQSLLASVALAGAALLLAACNDATAPDASLAPSLAVSETGNGAPSGAHFTLNLIGVGKDKSANMDAASGHVIFVDLGEKGQNGTTVTTKIMLEQSASAGEYQVLDKNGTDGEASFMLPAPGTYAIYARPLGTPGGKATITTCAEDVAGNGDVTDEVCSTENEVFVRGTGKSSFRNVTENLTTIYIDPVLDAAAVEACGDTVVSLFDPCLEGYFWKYDNNGLRVLQIRIYETAPTA